MQGIVNGIYLDIAEAHLGCKMLWKGGAAQLGQFVVLFTSMWARSFSPTSEFMGSSIKAKCEPVKKYKGTREKHISEPMKYPFGVEHYCDMAVSPTRSHLLWCKDFEQSKGIMAMPKKGESLMIKHGKRHTICYYKGGRVLSNIQNDLSGSSECGRLVDIFIGWIFEWNLLGLNRNVLNVFVRLSD